MRKMLLVLVFGSVLGGCVASSTITVETKPLSNGGNYFLKAKAAVAEKMREPEAARFNEHHSAYSLSNGDVVVCGIANGKNAVGVYQGNNPFIVRFRKGEAVRVYFDEELGHFVAKVCEDAASGEMMIVR